MMRSQSLWTWPWVLSPQRPLPGAARIWLMCNQSANWPGLDNRLGLLQIEGPVADTRRESQPTRLLAKATHLRGDPAKGI